MFSEEPSTMPVPHDPDDARTTKLETEIWREACRHMEIDGFVESVVEPIASFLDIDLLLVRRIELDSSRLRTVAVGTRSRRAPPLHSLSIVRPRVLDELGAHATSGGLVTRSASDGGEGPHPAVPEGVFGSVAVLGLASDAGAEGVVVFVRESGAPFGADDLAFIRRLSEAFTVALGNDRRLHETARLRAAAEADRLALLTRLDRHEISDAVVGADEGLRGVMQRVEQVARTDASVLILGETGSGKEVVARAIHTHSRRATGPIVRVNCGAIPSELVDSELFGHERGSFTGATGTRQGWFERADGGTLFLDEIGELPLAAQVRLLRVLQEGTLERVGGNRSITVDVRIVAATHRDLAAMVERGAFREDLWYRISVFPIRLPALRERLEDLPELARHFAARAGLRLGGMPLVPTPADVDLLLGYDWPGNVRELASVIERAAILGGAKRLDVRAALHGPTGSFASAAEPSGSTPMPASGTHRALGRASRADGPHVPSAMPSEGNPRAGTSSAASTAGFATLDQAMVEHIARALELTGGCIEGPDGAAALLGINPHTLRSRMRKFNLDWRQFRASR